MMIGRTHELKHISSGMLIVFPLFLAPYARTIFLLWAISSALLIVGAVKVISNNTTNRLKLFINKISCSLLTAYNCVASALAYL